MLVIQISLGNDLMCSNFTHRAIKSWLKCFEELALFTLTQQYMAMHGVKHVLIGGSHGNGLEAFDVPPTATDRQRIVLGLVYQDIPGLPCHKINVKHMDSRNPHSLTPYLDNG